MIKLTIYIAIARGDAMLHNAYSYTKPCKTSRIFTPAVCPDIHRFPLLLNNFISQELSCAPTLQQKYGLSFDPHKERVNRHQKIYIPIAITQEWPYCINALVLKLSIAFFEKPQFFYRFGYEFV